MADPVTTLVRLDEAHPRPEFSCGDNDIDEFFHADSIAGSRELLCVTYAIMGAGRAHSFFSVSNDSIKKEECPRSAWDRVVGVIPFTKRYSSMPAVKIGRLGVATFCQRRGCGTDILDYIKVSFTRMNKTGCRFLLVDAYNQEQTLNFYKKNGFLFLTGNDEKEETRIMYFDLLPFARAAMAVEKSS